MRVHERLTERRESHVRKICERALDSYRSNDSTYRSVATPHTRLKSHKQKAGAYLHPDPRPGRKAESTRSRAPRAAFLENTIQILPPHPLCQRLENKDKQRESTRGESAVYVVKVRRSESIF